MYKFKFKKILIMIGIMGMLCTLCCPNILASDVLHWYCKRNKDHKQPTLDSELSMIDQYGGVYVDNAHSELSDEKVVYLTFDAGYENGNVEKILNVLSKENVPGAFFILGNLINKNPELIKRMANDGHLVCNHTYSHKNITKLSKQALSDEIHDLEKAYSDLTGKQMAKYFRPPEGTFDQSSLDTVHNEGYKTVFWSFAYADWDNNNQMSKEAAMKKIIDNLHNGEIMLLHPTSATNAEIMQELILELKRQGYRFGTLDELCAD